VGLGRSGRVFDISQNFLAATLFDDEIRALRYLVVQTDSGLLGHSVLVNSDRVRRVDWVSGSVGVNQTRNQTARGWESDNDSPPPRDVEAALRTRVGTEARRH
jgi:hypothetical protein